MREALPLLTSKQTEFICNECNITKDELFELDEDSLYDDVYDVMCDIECAETPSSDEPLTEHCAIASDIVTILGNTISDCDD